MKKLLLSLAALAMIAVGCEKNEGPNVIESNKKSVDITIVNGVQATKAVAEVKPTPAGGAGAIQDREDKQAAASTTELKVLFANAAGNVVEAYSFAEAKAVENENGKWNYRFHGVHESVTQVAVVRNNAEEFVGTNLSVYANAAAKEVIVADLSALNLYGSSDIAWDGKTTCTVTDAKHNIEYTYNLYTAQVDVVPTLARVEITGITCTDLGETTFKASTDPTVTGGFDELALQKIAFGKDEAYYYTFTTNDILKGVYKDETEADRKTKRDLVPYNPGPGENKVIAWNIAPSVEYPSDNVPMTLYVKASAYDYDVNTADKTLTINGLTGADKFERSKIYRFAINFKESNLDESNEAICVDVTVKIADWVIVEVDPEFATNPVVPAE